MADIVSTQPQTNILDLAGELGKILADQAAARAKGRVEEAGVNQNQGRAEADIFRTRMASAIGGPAAEAKNTALGDTLSNVQPFSWTGDTKMVGKIPVPQATGGLTPANYGPNTRAAGTALSAQSLGRINDPAFSLPKPPVLAGVPQSGALDSILGAAGGIGSLLGALGKNASGGSFDLGKVISAIKNKLSGTSDGSMYKSPQSGYFDENGDWQAGDDPTMADNYGRPSDGNYGEFDDPTVSTDTQFNGIPGGYGGDTENPLSADPEWWKQFVVDDNTADGAGGEVTGTNWWEE